jgi:hypothetical protein
VGEGAGGDLMRVVNCDLDFYAELLSLLRPSERFLRPMDSSKDGLLMKTMDGEILIFVYKEGTK